MTKSSQPSTGTQGSRDDFVNTGKAVGFELTDEALNEVSAGAIDTYMQFKDSTGAWVKGE